MPVGVATVRLVPEGSVTLRQTRPACIPLVVGTMNCVVIAGAGFSGSHVIGSLAPQDYAVTVIDNLSSGKRQNLGATVKPAMGDVRDAQAVTPAMPPGTDTVFRLAAAQIDVSRAVEDATADTQVNVEDAMSVLQVCVTAGVRRLVMSSTGGSPYDEPAVLPAAEDTVIRPLSPYGVFKYCAEQPVSYFHGKCGLQTDILRYANVYGPRQDPSGEAGVFGIFPRRILLSQPCFVFGDGEQTRDFVFVDGVVRANVLGRQGPVGTCNIGTSAETPLNGLLAGFEHVVGHPVVREYVPARGRSAENSPECSKGTTRTRMGTLGVAGRRIDPDTGLGSNNNVAGPPLLIRGSGSKSRHYIECQVGSRS